MVVHTKAIRVSGQARVPLPFICHFSFPIYNLHVNAWVPDLAIIDAMFIINTTPLRQHKIREHYADFLFRQYAIPHFNLGTKEVHFVLTIQVDLVSILRTVSTKGGIQIPKMTSHFTFDPQSSTPRPWRKYLDCRQCKRSLVEVILYLIIIFLLLL